MTLQFLRRIVFEVALTVAGIWYGNAASILLWSVAGAATFAVVQLRNKPAAVGFSLAAVGERERADGSWEGADLMGDATVAIDRFQLTLTPDDEVRLLVEAQSPDGSWERLYLGTLLAHRDYALPAPQTFFGVQGNARVRLTVSRLRKWEAPVAAHAGEIQQGPPLPLSDHTPFHANNVRFTAARAAMVELSLHGR
jgi:hypothetical protein